MGDDEDAPLRGIFVDSFYLDKYEVTTSRYAKFLQATGSANPPEGWEEVNLDSGSGNLPVVGVDWRDADAYCRWGGAYQRKRSGRKGHEARMAARIRGATTSQRRLALISASLRQVHT
jgi:formylglycine-generating enzyme required for sulfatase activity